MATKKMPKNSMGDMALAMKFLSRIGDRRMPPKLEVLYESVLSRLKSLISESEENNLTQDQINTPSNKVL